MVGLCHFQYPGLRGIYQMSQHQEQSVEISASEPDWRRGRLRALRGNTGKGSLASFRDHSPRRVRGSRKYTLRCWAVVRHSFWSIASGAGALLTCHLDGVY